MKEAQFTTEIVNSLKDANCFAHKLGDAPITQAVLATTRFTPGKPFDIVAGVRGKLVGIETKQIRKWQAFGIRDMRPAQIEGLNALVETRNRAFVFLNVRVAPNFMKNQKRENRLIVFDWYELRERFELGSIKAKELKELSYVEGHKKRFSLDEFFEVLDECSIADF